MHHSDLLELLDRYHALLALPIGKLVLLGFDLSSPLAHLIAPEENTDHFVALLCIGPHHDEPELSNAALWRFLAAALIQVALACYQSMAAMW